MVTILAGLAEFERELILARTSVHHQDPRRVSYIEITQVKRTAAEQVRGVMARNKSADAPGS
jgi:hypothetical protein